MFPGSWSIWASITKYHDWDVFNQQKIISPSSGGREVRNQSAGRFSVGEGPLPFTTSSLSTVPYMVNELVVPSGVSFYEGTKPIRDGSSLMT